VSSLPLTFPLLAQVNPAHIKFQFPISIPMTPPYAPAKVSIRSVLTLLSAISALSTLSAAVYTWDPANTANGAVIDPGSGTWDTLAGNAVWNDGVNNVPWAQTSGTVGLHGAVFAGADAPAGTYIVSLATSVAVLNQTGVGALKFSSNGYVVSAAEASNFTLTSRQVTVDAGKTATLSGPLTLALTNTTGVNQFSGYGTLTAKDGAKINPAGNPTHGIGSNLTLQTGSVYTSGGSVILGGQSTDGSTTRVNVEGGSLNVTGSAISLILANVNSTSNAYSNTIVTLSSGSITNTSSSTGVRFGGATNAAANNSNVNGTINLDGGVLTAGRIFEASGVATLYNSTFNFNGGTLRAVATTSNGATFMETLNTANVKAGGAIIDTNGANITIGQPLLADATSTGGGLTKLGAGTLSLTGANTYAGPTLVNAGTLSVVAPYSAITATTVAADARLRIVAGATPSTLPALTLAAAAGVELNLGNYNAANVASASFASVTAQGDYLISLTGTNIPVGNYTIFTYGSKSGSGTATLGSLPPGVTATLTDNGSSLVLNVLTPQLTNYTWASTSGTWDTVSSNWTPGGLYVEGNLATFPNIAGENTITIAADRTPFSVEIQNTGTNTYRFEGPGAISGAASLTKSGTGMVTLAAANSYTGATAVNAGLLLVTENAALGSASGGTTVASGASLALDAGVTYTTAEPLVLTGSGYTTAVGLIAGTRGAIQGITGSSTYAGPISLGTGGARFGVQNIPGASLTLSGTISPAAGVTDSTVYFRAGNEDGNFIILTGTNNRWDKTSSIYCNVNDFGASGLRLGANDAHPTTASVVAGGTFASLKNTFDLNGFNQTLPGLVGSDGHLQITNLQAGTTSVLTLDTTIEDFSSAPGTNNLVEREFSVLSDGNGILALVKKGSFKQSLDGVHTYTGPTTIEAGTLAIVGIGSLGATPVTMLPGSTLDVSEIVSIVLVETVSTTVPRTEFALSGGLSGSGTLTATGKTVTVSSVFAPGALAVTGNLALAAGTATTLVAGATPAASSAVTVDGVLGLNGTVAITEAAGFDFATGQNFAFATATGGIIGGVTGVTVNGVALTEASPDVWTGTIAGLDYTFTEATATLAVSGGVVITPVQAWRDLYFPTAGNDGTGIGADNADPDSDGVANLVEYATNTSPVAANASVVVQGTNAGRLTLTFPRIDDPSLRYTVEGRDDLVTGTWSSVTPAAANNPSFGFAGSTPGVTETQSETVIDSVLLSTQPKRFLRLSVDFVQAP